VVTATPTLLSIRDVAERLAISEPTVWRHVRSGRLQAFKVGGAVRVRSGDCDRFQIPYEVRG
jgi:excisionase family DNA binding protein